MLGEFARTMLTDFPVRAILDRLVERIVDILPVTGAGVTLIEAGAAPRYFTASDDAAMRFERVQSDLGQGPCMAAVESGEAVILPDLFAESRFPDFTREARQMGLGAVFAFPLCHGDSQFGALDLYRDWPGPLDAQSMQSAQTLADVASAYLLNATVRTELEEALAAARKSALHDPLTGVANRVLLIELLGQALLRNRRTDTLTGVLFCDIDRLKRVNDVHGHGVGDELLIGVADRLRRILRPSDTLARLSGDEFVIVCEGLQTRDEAERIAGRALTEMMPLFELSIGSIECKVSIGIAFADGETASPDEVLHSADIAMYRAKRRGGDQYEILTPHRVHPTNARAGTGHWRRRSLGGTRLRTRLPR